MSLITIVCNNNEEIQSNIKLIEFSDVLKDLNIQEKFELCFSSQTIQNIIDFYEKFDFDLDAFQNSIFSSKVIND